MSDVVNGMSAILPDCDSVLRDKRITLTRVCKVVANLSNRT
jgi:hypothetical protein